MLTSIQIASVLMLLQAFGVGQQTLNIVRSELTSPTVQMAPDTSFSAAPSQVATAPAPVNNAFYKVVYESGMTPADIYIRSSGEIDPSTISIGGSGGISFTRNFEIAMGDRNCIFTDGMEGIPDGTKECGGYASRFVPSGKLSPGNYTLTIGGALVGTLTVD